MKKFTLSALAAIAVAGTSFAGPSVVMSKEYKQPCVTPCFRDQEFQLDLFYSYNNAEHQGNNSASEIFVAPPTTTSGLLPGLIPAGSTVIAASRATVDVPPYFRDGSGGGVGASFFFAKYIGIGVEGNWWNGVRSGFDGSFNNADLVILSGPVDPVALANTARLTNASITVLPDGNLVIRDRRSFGHTHRSVAHQVTGNLILRYPFEGPICWAPYIFGGGGGVFDGESTGFGDVGVGVEFRVTPNMGFFADWRWQFMQGDNDNDDIRNSSTLRVLRQDLGFRSLRTLENQDRNDVSMTRVGVRFAF